MVTINGYAPARGNKKKNTSEEEGKSKKSKKKKKKERKKVKNYQDLSRSILSHLVKSVVELTSLLANVLQFEQYSM